MDSIIRETGACVDDGLERVFVNTSVKDGTIIAEYMDCFLKKEVQNLKFPALTKRMYLLKHEERGVDAVCEVMEKYERKARAEGKAEGENLLGHLMNLLLKEDRTSDAKRAAIDPAFRMELYKKYHIS